VPIRMTSPAAPRRPARQNFWVQIALHLLMSVSKLLRPVADRLSATATSGSARYDTTVGGLEASPAAAPSMACRLILRPGRYFHAYMQSRDAG